MDRNGEGLLPQEADRAATLFGKRRQLLSGSLAVHAEWRWAVVTHGVSGVRVHDARILLAIGVQGVKLILTFKGKNFARYAHIESGDP